MVSRTILLPVLIVALGGLSNVNSQYVTVTSKLDPTKSWVCLTPKAGDDKTQPEYGSCMPDASCDAAGKSKWTNMFG